MVRLRFLFPLLPVLLPAATLAGPAAAAGTEAEGAPTLRLLTEENPPYNFRDTGTGTIRGSAVEIVGALMEGAGVKYSLTLLPWNRAFREVQESAGTCLFVVNRTPEREGLFEWVGPLITGGWALYRRPGSGIMLDSLADLEGQTVVGKMGSAGAATLEAETGLTITRATSDEQAARMLYHGRAHFWISGVVDAPAAARAIGMPPPELALLWKPADLSLACGPGTDPALIAKLNAVNRTLDDLRKRAIAHHLEGLGLEKD